MSKSRAVAINPTANGGEQVLFQETDNGLQICAMSHGSNSTLMEVWGVTADDLIRVGEELKARRLSTSKQE